MSTGEGTSSGSSDREVVVVDAGPVPTEVNSTKVFVDGTKIGVIQNWKHADVRVDLPVDISPIKGKLDFTLASISTQRLQPDRVFMNQQDFDDIVNWGAEEGLIVDPNAQRLRAEAKKAIEESDDPTIVAAAYEVLVTVPERRPRDFGIGSLDVAKEMEDVTIKDIQDEVDASILSVITGKP